MYCDAFFLSVFIPDFKKMKWSCKTCRFEAGTRTELLKHYRLRHGVVSRGQTVPCLYKDCPCSFRTFNALNIQHPQAVTAKEILSFSCVLCSSACFDSERQYFEHLGSHLRKFEVAACVFKNCTFSSNIYSTLFLFVAVRKHNTQTGPLLPAQRTGSIVT